MNVNDLIQASSDFTAYVKTCKASIKQAITAKGVAISDDDTLDLYAASVSAITGGGSGTVYTVQYIDWDDTLLKSQQVLPGGDVLPPINPSRESYNFLGWDGNSLNVQSDLTITAQYEYAPNIVVFTDYQGKIISTQNIPTGEDAVPPTTTLGNVILDSWGDYTNIQGNRTVLPVFHSKDNKTYITLTLDESTGLTPDFYFYVSSGILDISWGDGATAQANYTTHYTHTYPMYGTYVVELISTGNAYLGYAPTGLSGWVAAYSGNYAKAVKKVIVGTLVKVGGSAFMYNNNLNDLALVDFESYTDDKSFKECTALESILSDTPIIGPELFTDCSNLKTIILTNTSVVTLSNLTALSGTHEDLKIYVPADLLDSYKTATPWSLISSKIFTINELSVYGN